MLLTPSRKRLKRRSDLKAKTIAINDEGVPMSDGVIAEKRFDTPSLSYDKSLFENPIYHET